MGHENDETHVRLIAPQSIYIENKVRPETPKSALTMANTLTNRKTAEATAFENP